MIWGDGKWNHLIAHLEAAFKKCRAPRSLGLVLITNRQHPLRFVRLLQKVNGFRLEGFIEHLTFGYWFLAGLTF